MSSEANVNTQANVVSKINMSKTNDKKVTKTIVTSPHIYKPVGPYR